ncbi:hypothetical protein OFO16_09110 [Vibrio natriegens]|uniref:hypothetical protein n=1 Tax=Vibrio natriegens TaxID=691 RepID=UPI0021E749F0|nr:hypothetical protein [Vibrio natriegens]UYI46020.1 hypothetical protein OFO16_09110 [Vibrio natriegens]
MQHAALIIRPQTIVAIIIMGFYLPLARMKNRNLNNQINEESISREFFYTPL